MGKNKDSRFTWRIKMINTHQYAPPGDDMYLGFELRNDRGLTSLEVQLPWTGRLIDLMSELESEVRQRIAFYLDEVIGD